MASQDDIFDGYFDGQNQPKSSPSTDTSDIFGGYFSGGDTKQNTPVAPVVDNKPSPAVEQALGVIAPPEEKKKTFWQKYEEFGQKEQDLAASALVGLSVDASKLFQQVLRIPESFGTGQKSIEESLRSVGLPDNANPYLRKDNIFTRAQDKVSKSAGDLRTNIKKGTQNAESYFGEINPTYNTIEGQIASTIGGMVPNAVAALAGAPTTLLSLSEAFMNAEDSYDENIKQGVSEEDALKGGAAQLTADLALTYLTNKFGALAKFGGEGKPIINFGKSKLSSFLSQGLEMLKDNSMETLQEVGQQVLQNTVTGKPITDGLGPTAIVSFIASMPFSFVGSINLDTPVGKAKDILQKKVESVNSKIEQGKELTPEESAFYAFTDGVNPLENVQPQDEVTANDIKELATNVATETGDVAANEIIDQGFNEGKSEFEIARDLQNNLKYDLKKAEEVISKRTSRPETVVENNPIEGFKKSENQKKVGKSGDVTFEIGSFGENAITRKADQEDRVPQSELKESLKHISDTYVAGNTSFRKDNLVHIAEMPNGEKRAIVTRKNANGSEEVINFFKIGRDYNNFIKNLESFGVPERNRTPNHLVRTESLYPLSHKDTTSVADATKGEKVDKTNDVIDNQNYERTNTNEQYDAGGIPADRGSVSKDSGRNEGEPTGGMERVRGSDNGYTIRRGVISEDTRRERKVREVVDGVKQGLEGGAKPYSIAVTQEDIPVIKQAFTELGFSEQFNTVFQGYAEKGFTKNVMFANIVKNERVFAAYNPRTDTFIINPDMASNSMMQDGSILHHELGGHAWYFSLSADNRKTITGTLSTAKGTLQSVWSRFGNTYKDYWTQTYQQIKKHVKNSAGNITDDVLAEAGFTYDPEISIGSFIDQSLDINKAISQINDTLVARNLEPINLRAENTIAVAEHIAFLAETANTTTSNSDFVQAYIDSVENNTLVRGDESLTSLRNEADAIAETRKEFKGFTDITTRILEDLKGRKTVSKQYLLDATNRPEVRQVEKDIVRSMLAEYPDGQIPVIEFADKIRGELLPLSYKSIIPKYEYVNLPKELRSDVKNYREHIYESPIRTSGALKHFSGGGLEAIKNYFSHTRFEDLADDQTRRIIELQSDLMQKGGLENERGHWELMQNNESYNDYQKRLGDKAKTISELSDIRDKQLEKLTPYRNIWWERIIREEIKKAAQDSIAKLQFPTGETAMKIEGLGQANTWSYFDSPTSTELLQLTPDALKVGQEITMDESAERWIVTDVLGDGKFKAVPKEKYQGYEVKITQPKNSPDTRGIFIDGTFEAEVPVDNLEKWLDLHELKEGHNEYDLARYSETFDISGKVDTNNPIYKFYEKDIQKYLTKFGGKKITDSKGVTWVEVPVDQAAANNPVLAFRLHDDIDKLDLENKALKDPSKEHFVNTNPYPESKVQQMVYHGSSRMFDVADFNLDKIGEQGFSEGKGYYFTDDKAIAQGYATVRGEGLLFEGFLNMQKPMTLEQREITAKQLEQVFKKLYKLDNEALANYGDVNYEGLASVIKSAVETESSNETDVDLIASIGNGGIADAQTINDVFREVTGYDGVIAKWPQGTDVFVVFNPDQIVDSKDLAALWDTANTKKPQDYKTANEYLDAMYAKGDFENITNPEDVFAKEIAFKREWEQAKDPELLFRMNDDMSEQDKLDLLNYEIDYYENKVSDHPGKELSKFKSRREGEFLDLIDPDTAKTPKERARIVDRNEKVMLAAQNAFADTGLSDVYDDPDAIREAIAEYEDSRDKLKELKQQRAELKVSMKEQLNPVTNMGEKVRDAKVALELAEYEASRPKPVQKRNVTIMGEPEQVPEDISYAMDSYDQAVDIDIPEEYLKGPEKEIEIQLEDFTVEKEAEAFDAIETRAKPLDRSTAMVAFDEGMKRAKAAFEKAQSKIRAVNKAYDTPVEKMSLWEKAKRSLNPLSFVPGKTAKLFKDWYAKRLIATRLANEEVRSLNIPEADAWQSVLDYEAGISNENTKQIKEKFDSMYAEARDQNIDFGYRANYVPHVYQETPEEIDQKIKTYLTNMGLNQDQVVDYVTNGKKLPNEVAKYLKLDPYFSRVRTFPDYKTAMEYGLTPKFTNPNQLVAYYREELQKTIANRDLLNALIESGDILTGSFAPRHWEHINPQFSSNGYYASPHVAKVINGLFPQPGDFTTFNSFMKLMRNVSGKMQEISLSAGLPGTSLNFFAIGQLVKELTSGNVKAINAFLRANFSERSANWMAGKRDMIRMMANNGIDLRTTVDSYAKAYDNMIAKKSWKDRVSNIFDEAFNKATFSSFIPMMQVQVFEDTYAKLLKQGYKPEFAQQIAAQVIKKGFGIAEFGARGEKTEDELGAIFFAPKFRESVLNSLYNTGLAGVDFVSAVGGLRKPLDPSLNKNLKLLLGMILSFGLYDLLNYRLNGHNMWDNPKNREFALQIPTDDGTLIYIEFMPSFLSFGRNLASGALSLATGDISNATQKFGSLFSMPIKIFTEIVSNQDYFGNPIYKDTDTGVQKVGKIAKYAGLQVNHPYIKEVVNQIGDTKPLYQSVVAALELPLKFSSMDKVSQQEFYDAMDKMAKSNAREIERMRPTYDRIQELKDEDPAKALEEYNKLSEHDKSVYKKIKQTSGTKTSKSSESTLYTRINAIKQAKESGDIEKATNLYNQLNDSEKEVYQKVKDKSLYKESFKKSDGSVVEKTASEDSFLGLVTEYAKAFSISPKQAFKALLTTEQLNYAAGNVVTLKRFKGIPFNQPGGSEEYIRNQLLDMGINLANRSDYNLEHIVPLAAGGDNSSSNLKVVDRATHNAWTPYDIALGDAVRNKKVSMKEAAKIATDFKSGKITGAEFYTLIK